MKFFNSITDRQVKILFVGILSIVLLCAAPAAFAAFPGGELDASFVPAFVKDNQAIGNAVLIQPDGKILYAGLFLNVNLQPRGSIARFNADGSLDATFDSGGTIPNATISAMALQPDGKIVIVGAFDTIGGQARKNIARLNADGSFDPTFNAVVPASSGTITAVAVQADGKILFSGNFSSVGGQTRSGFARVNSDGSLDTSFNPPCGNGGVLAIQADGKILIGNSCGAASSGGVSRLTATGAVDSTFNVGTGANGSAVRSIVVQPDGKVLIGGQFSTFSGQTRRGIARVNADGTLDTSFVPASDFSTNSIALQADGKIVIGRNSSFAGVNPVFRLNPNGTNDTTFNANQTQVNDINSIAVASDGSVYEAGRMIISGANFSTVFKPFIKLNSVGQIDDSFDPYILYASLSFGVTNVVVQPNGKIIVAGEFSTVNRQTRSTIVRLNADGSLDSTFNLDANAGIFNGTINAVALQPDGKILVGSDLPTAAANRIIRLNADGSRDSTFNVAGGASDSVKFIALQPDGRILVAGNFVTIGGQTRNSHFARLNADGSVEAFNPTFNAQNYVSSLLVQPDGKFIISGNFSSVNGTTRGATARFNADGTIDATFANTDFGFSIPIYYALQADGKIIATNTSSVIRLNADNTTDNSFSSRSFSTPSGAGTGTISTVAVQSDGKILVGGSFTYTFTPSSTVVFRNNFARLNQDGSIDTSFGNYGGAFGGAVNKITLQPDGKILLGGAFKTINYFGHSGLARLNQIVSQSNRASDFDGDGKADASVFRSGTWFINPSSAPNSFYGVPFGLSSDKLTPADFDGDGKTDIAVWREGSFANFYVLQSATNTLRAIQFGTIGDNPIVAGDWDGDGKADAAVYRSGAAGAASFFYYRPSSQASVDFVPVQWGTSGDLPMRGDFDGDGKLDAAVFRPSNNTWYIRQSASSTARYEQFGTATDKFVPADYDGDGKTDLAVFRSGVWYIKQSSDNQVVSRAWGTATDTLVPADYDGDGKTDVAVYRNGVYYVLTNSNTPLYLTFGAAGDTPIASAFVQ